MKSMLGILSILCVCVCVCAVWKPVFLCSPFENLCFSALSLSLSLSLSFPACLWKNKSL